MLVATASWLLLEEKLPSWIARTVSLPQLLKKLNATSGDEMVHKIPADGDIHDVT